jgi:hypothetical protein
MEMTDRLTEIKGLRQKHQGTGLYHANAWRDLDWLIAEVERLRERGKHVQLAWNGLSGAMHDLRKAMGYEND